MRWPFLVFSIVAAAPFALLRCKSAGEPPPAAAPAVSTAPPSDAAIDIDPPDAAIVLAPPPIDAGAFALPPPPKYDPAACPPLDAAIAKIWKEQSCRIDSDCAVGYGYCSCGSPIAARALPKLEAVGRDWSDHACFMKHPIPCPSCPPPPKPRCVRGRCGS